MRGFDSLSQWLFVRLPVRIIMKVITTSESYLPSEPGVPRVPTYALFVLEMTTSQPGVGDLTERFEDDWVPRLGPRKARRLFWLHTVKTMGNNITETMKEIVRWEAILNYLF